MPRLVKLMVSALYYTNARRMYYSFAYCTNPELLNHQS
jgi:hypothetical protein